jgi:hypothetical protein
MNVTDAMAASSREKERGKESDMRSMNGSVDTLVGTHRSSAMYGCGLLAFYGRCMLNI